MQRSSPSYAFLMPCFALAVSLTAIAVPATLGYLNLQRMAHGEAIAYLNAGEFNAQIPRNRFLYFAIIFGGARFSHFVSALNMPGCLGMPLLSAFRHLPFLPFEFRRTITFPVFSFPAWWLVGSGLDSWMSRRRIHWGLCLTGTLLCIACCVLAVGFRLEIDPADHVEGTWIIWGLALWTVLFGVLPFAWWRQWQVSRTPHHEPL